MSACECTIPDGGWCERHKLQKSANWVHLCRTNKSYWKAWEEGGGPGRNLGDGQSESRPAQSPGPGTELRKILGCGKCRFYGRMNKWGADVCLARIEEIVGWMLDAGGKAKSRMSEDAARRLVTLAIERSRATVAQAVGMVSSDRRRQ